MPIDDVAAAVEEESSDAESLPDALIDWLVDDCGIDEPRAPLLPALHTTTDDQSDDEDSYVPVPYEVQCSAEDWELAAARSFKRNGFCVLRGTALVSEATCNACAAAAAERLDRLFDSARKLGLHPRRDVMRYSEICSRRAGGMRYDQRWWSAGSGVENASNMHAEAQESTTAASAAVASTTTTASAAAASTTAAASAATASTTTTVSASTASSAANTPACVPACMAELQRSVERWVRPFLLRLCDEPVSQSVSK